jgi:hypothetical protein
VWGYYLIIAEEDAIVRDAKRIEKIRLIKKRGRINYQ